MIQRVCGESIAEERHDIVRGPKSCKLTIRLTQRERFLIEERAEYEGFRNRTRWASALIRATLLREPVMNEEERSALLDVCFTLSDLIESSGGNVLGINRLRIKDQDREKINIQELQRQSKELHDKVMALVSGSHKRWNLY